MSEIFFSTVGLQANICSAAVTRHYKRCNLSKRRNLFPFPFLEIPTSSELETWNFFHLLRAYGYCRRISRSTLLLFLQSVYTCATFAVGFIPTIFEKRRDTVFPVEPRHANAFLGGYSEIYTVRVLDLNESVEPVRSNSGREEFIPLNEEGTRKSQHVES